MFGLLWLRVRHDVIVGMWHNNTTLHTQIKHTQLPQDYSEEFRDIGGVKGKGKAQLPEGAITLINQRIVTDDLPVISSTPYENKWSLNLIRVTPTFSLDHETLKNKRKSNQKTQLTFKKKIRQYWIRPHPSFSS